MGRRPTRKAAAEVYRALSERYPDAECALIHDGPWQLLCATILSAQCTDVRVNMVTPALFARFPTPQQMATADELEVQQLIHTTGFFRAKARSLVDMSRDVVERFGGEIPRELADLVSLRGVGRKTANVIIGVAFGGAGMVVDTHVRRLSKRLGWTTNDDPVKIEQDLMRLHPREAWTHLGHTLILHGRDLCDARSPRCTECPVLTLCPEGVRRTVPSPATPVRRGPRVAGIAPPGSTRSPSRARTPGGSPDPSA